MRTVWRIHRRCAHVSLLFGCLERTKSINPISTIRGRGPAGARSFFLNNGTNTDDHEEDRQKGDKETEMDIEMKNKAIETCRAADKIEYSMDVKET